MPAKFVSGNLFTYPGLEALAHGCNCMGMMGKGIALEFKNKFPAMFREYRDLCNQKRFHLGCVFTWRADSGLVIFNLATQQAPRVQADLQAIEQSVARMLKKSEALSITTIGLPRIGAGLGGADWEDIKRLLILVGDSTGINLVVVEQYLPSYKR
jgi:O-acetyl-ADP-ribose deacetylase (regulator of RNase III)